MKKLICLPILLIAAASAMAADTITRENLPGSPASILRTYKDLQDGTSAPAVNAVPRALATCTYTASTFTFTPGTTPGDVFTITGSATKTVKILRMGLASNQGTAGTNNWFIVKRNTANSGGTSTSVAGVPHDSTNAAATATVLEYTVNPTSGTLVGQVWSGKLDSPIATTAGIGGSEGVEVSFAELYGQPITLRGVNDVLAWNFNLAALPSGLTITAYVTWTEE